MGARGLGVDRVRADQTGGAEFAVERQAPAGDADQQQQRRNQQQILLQQIAQCGGARDGFPCDRDAARWSLARLDRLDAAPQFGIERNVVRNMHAARAGNRPADSLQLLTSTPFCQGIPTRRPDCRRGLWPYLGGLGRAAGSSKPKTLKNPRNPSEWRGVGAGGGGFRCGFGPSTTVGGLSDPMVNEGLNSASPGPGGSRVANSRFDSFLRQREPMPRSRG